MKSCNGLMRFAAKKSPTKKSTSSFGCRRPAPTWKGIRPALQQVFWNLIKNSVKFTPEQGQILVETLNPVGPTKFEIKITDTGIGIDQDKIDKIFNAFEQGQTSITRRFGGLGLGWQFPKRWSTRTRVRFE